jgi:glutathione S-transferase
MSNILYIGNKNYSSWSLRAWLCLKWAGIPFEEKLIRLDQPGYGEAKNAEVLSISPTGFVPALHHDGVIIWDSLAIAEWAAEHSPSAMLWPEDALLRAKARSVASEMHSGFAAVRRDLSMNIRRRSTAPAWKKDTNDNIRRIFEVWTQSREQHAKSGPYLFGQACIADAFYLPVATRFRSYGVALTPILQEYSDTLLCDPSFKQWESECIPDSWDQSGYSVIDGLYR